MSLVLLKDDVCLFVCLDIVFGGDFLYEAVLLYLHQSRDILPLT